VADGSSVARIRRRCAREAAADPDECFPGEAGVGCGRTRAAAWSPEGSRATRVPRSRKRSSRLLKLWAVRQTDLTAIAPLVRSP
jgi:hypothetical protein